MSDNTYNGWTNWETWQVLLWADNEQAWHREVCKFVEWAAPLAAFDEKCKQFFREMFPEGTPDMDGAHELDKVNWKEIAEHLEDWNV
jgi:hypothetical protein